MKKKYEGKLFSVLGDSVSTLWGWSEPSYAVFYTRERCYDAEILSEADTWWGQVISCLGGTLLVNNSISGSTVRKTPQTVGAACSEERISALGRKGFSPDVIMIPMGMNDWGCAARPTPVAEAEAEDSAIFSVAYRRMLRGLQKQYPKAELWCFTLPVSTFKARPSFHFPYVYAGRHIEEYCAVIRTCAKEHECRVIDVYAAGLPYDTVDGFHPNADGMKTLSSIVLSALDGEV